MREIVYGKIAEATALIRDKARLPEYDVSLTESAPRLEGFDLWEIFQRNFKAVNGKTMSTTAELITFLRGNGLLQGYCDPALYPGIGEQLSTAGLKVETEFDRSCYDDYQFGITRASGAIAESGTLIIDDEGTSRRLAALAPWVHVGVLRRGEIHRSIHDALAALGDSPNVIWCTGPSKTADVEGILIEGVHGPGEQIALMIG